jgi:hypothetical protein
MHCVRQEVNAFVALLEEKVYSPFFFIESTLTGSDCTDMQQEWLMQQLKEDKQICLLTRQSHITFS